MEWNITTSRSRIKKEILEKELLEYKCNICEVHKWLNNPLTLHLDHINGESNDNRLENLRFFMSKLSQSDSHLLRKKQ